MGGGKEIKEVPTNERRGKEWRPLLTANAAVHHPADHAEQEKQVTHEVAMVAASCEGKQQSLSTS